MATPLRLGDYLVFPAFAHGGTAAVHIARLVRSAGFRRLVVVKRLQVHLIDDPGAPDRLLREAQLSSRVRSPYVISTLDVVHKHGDLALVMDFVHGVTLGRLLQLAHERGTQLPARVAVAITCNVLRGLHAAHEAKTEDGRPLELMHRDVAHGNVMVGADGIARVVDFEIATALGLHGTTSTGAVRGTLGSMAPEQLRGGRAITRQADLYATGVLLWETLTGRPLREGDAATVLSSLDRPPEPPSKYRPDVPAALDAVILRALRVEPSERPVSAEAMAADLEEALAPAAPHEVARIVEKVAFDELERLRELVAECERYEPSDEHTGASSDVREGGLVGSTIAGKYKVESILGRGGMGIVVQARHTTLGEAVAIKIVHAAAEGEATSSTERIVREARASLRIKSDHVVRVFDVGVEQGRAYLVMEKLDGVDLRSLLRERGSLPIEEAVRYVLQACEVLAEAHALGIVHRDLKPANLFVTKSADETRVPFVKVLDFGIAKATSSDYTMTETRALLGSPAYMSPEQLRSARQVDTRTDVWSLGVVLYELLANAHPFGGEDGKASLAGIVADDPAPLRARRTEVPDALERVIMRCLAKDPARRVQSIVELATALERFSPEGAVSLPYIRRFAGDAPPVSERPRSRRKALWALAGAAALALAGTAAIRASHDREANAEVGPSSSTSATAFGGSLAPPSASVAPSPSPSPSPSTSTPTSTPTPTPTPKPQPKTGTKRSPTKPAPVASEAPTTPAETVATPAPPAGPPPQPSTSAAPPKKKDPTAGFE